MQWQPLTKTVHFFLLLPLQKGVGNGAASSSPLPLPMVPSLPQPPPPRAYPVAPLQSRRVIPKQPSNATEPAFSGLDLPVLEPTHLSTSLPDITVEFLLMSTWYFSTGYPLSQTSILSGKYQASQALTWAATVAELSRTLVNKTTGTEHLTCSGRQCMYHCFCHPDLD